MATKKSGDLLKIDLGYLAEGDQFDLQGVDYVVCSPEDNAMDTVRVKKVGSKGIRRKDYFYFPGSLRVSVDEGTFLGTGKTVSLRDVYRTYLNSCVSCCSNKENPVRFCNSMKTKTGNCVIEECPFIVELVEKSQMGYE